MGKRILLPIDWVERLQQASRENRGRPKGSEDNYQRTRKPPNPGPEKKTINRPPAVYDNINPYEKYGI